jgi:hypothetical protein
LMMGTILIFHLSQRHFCGIPVYPSHSQGKSPITQS